MTTTLAKPDRLPWPWPPAEPPELADRPAIAARVRRAGRPGLLRAAAVLAGLGGLVLAAVERAEIWHVILAAVRFGIIAGVAALVLAAIVTGLWVWFLVKTHGVARIAARFVFGHHLDGHRRTDAGFLRRGVRVLHPTGHASRWAHLRHAERAAIRLAAVALIVATCAGLATDATVTVALLLAFATAGLGFGAWWTHRQVRELAHTRKYVRPLHAALAPQIGHPLAARPRGWLSIPRDFGRVEGSQIRIGLPPGFLGTPDAKRIIMTALSDKLAIEDGTVTFHTVGAAPYALVTASIPPPDRLTFAAARAAVEAAPESAPLIGLGRSASHVCADWDADSPHALMSAGSGGGKSTVIRCLFCQGLHHGSLGIVLDLKRMSQAWARGLPNVIYCRSIAEIHNMLIALGAEVERRNLKADELADEDGDIPDEAFAEIGPRLLIVCEEMNATANRLTAYWRKIKGKDDPSVSPAIEALNDVLFMGRAVRVNVLAVAQMMTARALGGPEARENFSTRILARYTMNAWKMLVPEVWPMPKSSRHQGRVQVVNAGVARETQVVFFTPKEAREWALSGAVARIAESTLAGGQVSYVPRSQVPSTRESEGGTVPPSAGPVTLREAVDSGTLTVSIESARAARKRDPEFPPPAGIRDGAITYERAALTSWERNRVRTRDDNSEAEGA
ncbi:MAG: hypothetical protein ACRDPD_02710 [Streptosporangiaceae bacterium]